VTVRDGPRRVTEGGEWHDEGNMAVIDR